MLKTRKLGLLLVGTVSLTVLAIVALVVMRSPDRKTEGALPAQNLPSIPKPGLPPPVADPKLALLGSDSSISSTARALILVATEPGQTARDGRASLGTDVRNPQTYAAGAVLANGAVLEEIFADYVVLSREGKRFVLAVDGTTPKVSAQHRSLSIAEDVLQVGGAGAVNRPLERIASSRIDLSDVIRAEPLFERDEFAGLRILPGTDRSKLAVLELQSGDIVRSIDGKRLKSPAESWQMIDDAISTGTPIVVTIDREGSLLSMSVDGSRLAASEVQLTSSEMPMASPGS